MDEESHDSKENLVDISDGKWIPRDRFDQVNGQVRQLREEIEALKTPAAQALPTFAELINAVELGEMTQAEADEINAARIRQDVLSEVSEAVSQSNVENSNQAMLREYISYVPELDVEGSDINNRVVQEYQELLALGQPNNTSTQVAAVRSVLGPPQLLKQKIEGRKKIETHQEGGSSGGSEEGASDWDKIPARNRAFYEKALRNGAYPNQEACVEEAKAAGII